jgi:hypothetical protein
MNIFAIEGNITTGEIDWIESAKSQDNLRVVKMTLETCQILSTALNTHGLAGPYRSFNPKHPSCLWAIESSSNFLNLFRHGNALSAEYTERFSKIHKCQHVLNQISARFDHRVFPESKPTPLRLAIPEEFKTDNPILSYRKFYASKPRIRYPLKKIPSWFLDLRGNLDFDIIKEK